ncbi:MAG TPA: hypothetical protein VNN22_20600 [Verrucomicrobiae bacterium]|nr:hypothetical protein [Verrucomicrobiae bacterium]
MTDAEMPEALNIAVAEPDIIKDNPYRSRIPVSSAIYKDVIYAAQEAEDRGKGIKNVEYLLAPPDPWLVALGLVMWEGIVQGFAWDAVKGSVLAALGKLRQEGVAPVSDKHKVTRKDALELGFCWVKYADDKKLEEVFIGLRKSHENETKPVEIKINTRRLKK